MKKKFGMISAVTLAVGLLILTAGGCSRKEETPRIEEGASMPVISEETLVVVKDSSREEAAAEEREFVRTEAVVVDKFSDQEIEASGSLPEGKLMTLNCRGGFAGVEIGDTIVLRGWVKSIRSQKNVVFIKLEDTKVVEE
jgi:hypothetical protein